MHSTEGLSDRITAGLLSPHRKVCTEFVNAFLDYNFNSEKTNFVRWIFIKKKQGSIGIIYPIHNSKARFLQARKTHISMAINETRTRITSFELMVFTGLQNLGF